jgi:dTDP-glucose 4,6-dehydratase
MKSLVTGGAGIICSAVIRHVIHSSQYNVINLDKRTYTGSIESLNIVSNKEKFFFEKLFFLDRSESDRVIDVQNPGVKMHLSAVSQVDQTDLVESNAFRTFHIATVEVYGDLEVQKALYTAITAYLPYSVSKISSYHLVSVWLKIYGFTFIINNYGPYHFPKILIVLLLLSPLEYLYFFKLVKA